MSSKSVTGKVLLAVGKGAVKAGKAAYTANQARHTTCAGCGKTIAGGGRHGANVCSQACGKVILKKAAQPARGN